MYYVIYCQVFGLSITIYKACFQNLLICVSGWGHVLTLLMCFVFPKLGFGLRVLHWLYLVIRQFTHHILIVIVTLVVVLLCLDLVYLYLIYRHDSILQFVMTSSALNMLCCFLQCWYFQVAIASVYWSPSFDVKQCIEDFFVLLSWLSTHSQYIILVGDLNIDLLCHLLLLITLPVPQNFLSAKFYWKLVSVAIGFKLLGLMYLCDIVHT